MSSRTMPDSIRTFGPFDPSPGYGPAVSAGAAVTQDAASPVPSVDDVGDAVAVASLNVLVVSARARRHHRGGACDAGELEDSAARQDPQIVGQAEVVFVLHGLHGAPVCCAWAMSLLSAFEV